MIQEYLQMYFSLKFNIWLRWKDQRIGYEFLKQDSFENEIEEKIAEELWKPILIFENHKEREIERQLLRYSPIQSIMMAQKNGQSTGNPLFQIYEARLYSPNETEILWRSRHYKKFKCHFNMFYFPFDHQTCYVKVLLIVSASCLLHE